MNLILSDTIDELSILEEEHTKCKKHEFQSNRDLAHAKLTHCEKQIIEILKSNYDHLS